MLYFQIMARGGKVSKSQPVINRRPFPPLNRRSVNDLTLNWQNLVNTANPQPGLPQGSHQGGVQPLQQPVLQPDQQARQADPVEENVNPQIQLDQADMDLAHQAEQPQHEQNVVNGAQLDLTAWIDPVIPEAVVGPPPEDTDGWTRIDSLGAWECGLCPFRTLEEVPPAYRTKWTKAMSTILRRVISAQSEEELNRGLKWFLVSAQVFFREPKRGGKKGQSNAQIALRFDCLARGDWGSLLTQLRYDKETGSDRQPARRAQKRDEDAAAVNAKLRKTVLAMLARGQIGRAVRRICSNGVANMADPDVRAALQSKYKHRVRDLPLTVSKGECVQSLGGLKDSLLELQTGVSPGFGGLRNEHLRCYAETGEEEDINLLEAFCLKYVKGEFPPWFSKVWNSVSTVPLYKPDGSLRPVGIKPSFIRDLHKAVIRANKGVLCNFLEPQQVALSQAGGAKLVHSVRMLLEHRRDFFAVKLDIRNAHNEVSRASIIEALEKEPSLRHLAWHVATCLAAPTSLEAGGELWGETGEGHSQGDPEASACFCVAWHQQVIELDSRLQTVGGMAKFGNDDGYAIGPASVLFPAIAHFAQEIKVKHLLELQVQKTEVFSWSGLLPPEAPPTMKVAGTTLDGVFHPGMVVYGIPVGSDSYVQHMLHKEVDDIASDMERIKEVLAGENQAMWGVLYSSLAHKLDYHLTLCYPSNTREIATRLDLIFWSLLESLVRVPIPRGGVQIHPRDCLLQVESIGWLNNKTFQQVLIPQPVKLGGLGIRSLAETAPAAFIGGLEMSLPHFTGTGGICPNLVEVVGMVEGASRWDTFLTMGSRTAKEFLESWSGLKSEAEQYAAYLEKELTEPLSQDVVSAGSSSVDGSTRRKVVQQREGLRHEVLAKALKEHPDRLARPVTVFPNFDKLSGAWLLALPGSVNGLSATVFAETMAAHLCLPSPSVMGSGWVGKTLGRRGAEIDVFGDTVMNCSELPGDSWRHRHDTAKTAIATACYEARLPADCEVYGLFCDLLPASEQNAGGDLEWGRARQALIPDYRLRLPTPEGSSDCLAELKVTSAGVTWYPRGVEGRGTDRRAGGLQGLYKGKLAKYDTKYHGTAPGQVGPLVQRLDSYGKLWGLVVGPWGEGSKDLHSLITVIGKTMVETRGRERGWEGGAGEMGQVIGQLRRRLSSTFVKAQALCLLSRLGQLGPGAKAAAERRHDAMRAETERRREAQAHWQAHVRGRGLGKVGMLFVP